MNPTFVIPLKKGAITVLWGPAGIGKTITALKLGEALGKKDATVVGDRQELETKSSALNIDAFLFSATSRLGIQDILSTAHVYNEKVIIIDDVRSADIIQCAYEEVRRQDIAVVVSIQSSKQSNGCGEIASEYLDVFAKMDVGSVIPVLCQSNNGSRLVSFEWCKS